MTSSGADYKELEKLQGKLEDLEKRKQEFIEGCARELAARLLRKVVKRTPVGIYTNGVVGGTLRRGWEPNWQMDVKRVGNEYVIDIINAVEYASYVEYGHRTPNHRGWVEGRFMLTISVNEVQNIAPKLLEKRLKEWIGGAM